MSVQEKVEWTANWTSEKESKHREIEREREIFHIKISERLISRYYVQIIFMHFKTQGNIFHCCFQEVLLVMHVMGVFFTSFDFNFEEFCNFLIVILMMHAISQGYPDFGLNY